MSWVRKRLPLGKFCQALSLPLWLPLYGATKLTIVGPIRFCPGVLTNFAPSVELRNLYVLISGTETEQVVVFLFCK